jgi:hypothetical protein
VYECGSSIPATAGTDFLEFYVGCSVIFPEFHRYLGNKTNKQKQLICNASEDNVKWIIRPGMGVSRQDACDSLGIIGGLL